MKNELRKEVDEILTNKLEDAIKRFEAERNEQLEQLLTLRKAVEDLELEKAGIMEAMKGLNTRRASDLGEHNRLDGKLRWLERQMKGKRGQVDTLFARLTEVDIDPKTLTLFLHFKSVKDA